MKEYLHCQLCPRQCGADRSSGNGFCGETNRLRIARASLHLWEEPPISGKNGSGTVFFSGCNLGCVFCQNREIAHEHRGKEISAEALAEIFLVLQNEGAANINLVTAVHFVPHVIQALDLAKSNGLSLPVVYNSSGYESVETLRMLSGYIDVYLPDYKYRSSLLAERFSKAKNYPEAAERALAEMVLQTGPCVFDENGIIRKGVIVRHLVLPGHTEDSMAVLEYLHKTYGDSIYISIMNQYTPMGKYKKFPELSRKLTSYEYGKVVKFAEKIGIRNGFLQSGETAKESFIPSFDLSDNILVIRK
ncbi:MAG: radical SAM protein [Clostridia bacterium]|nr:radical SAM protein [Clostridia bacterium]